MLHNNGESSEDRQVGSSAFNTNYNDNAYVGYMYGNVGSVNYKNTHANINDSTIKKYLEEWYKINIEEKNFNINVADSIFCNDRELTLTTDTGYGTGPAHYGIYERVNGTPTLECKQENDNFSVNLNIGNGKLKYPVGLITGDEIMFAVGKYNKVNNQFYLYTGYNFWTLSPYIFNISSVRLLKLYNEGNLFYEMSNTNGGIRPVISLKSDIKITGKGTMQDPFKVQ